MMLPMSPPMDDCHLVAADDASNVVIENPLISNQQPQLVEESVEQELLTVGQLVMAMDYVLARMVMIQSGADPSADAEVQSCVRSSWLLVFIGIDLFVTSASCV